MPALSPTPQRNSRMKITMYWIQIVPFSQSQTLSSVSKMCELPNYPWSTLKCRINAAAGRNSFPHTTHGKTPTWSTIKCRINTADGRNYFPHSAHGKTLKCRINPAAARNYFSHSAHGKTPTIN